MSSFSFVFTHQAENVAMSFLEQKTLANQELYVPELW